MSATWWRSTAIMRGTARRDATVLVALEARERHGAEDLLGRRELGEEPREVDTALDAPADLLGEHRLGRPGRADDEDVLARDEGAKDPVHDGLALEEDLAQLRPDGAEPVDRVHASKCSASA